MDDFIFFSANQQTEVPMLLLERFWTILMVGIWRENVKRNAFLLRQSPLCNLSGKLDRVFIFQYGCEVEQTRCCSNYI